MSILMATKLMAYKFNVKKFTCTENLMSKLMTCAKYVS